MLDKLLKKSEVKPEPKVPPAPMTQQVDLSKVEFIFTGAELDQIVNYLKRKPWEEVFQLMGLIFNKKPITKEVKDGNNNG
jgi:hypothetical protein